MPASSTSPVWQHFTRSVDKKYATCNICNKKLVFSGTTSNLLNHLNRQHPTTPSKDAKKQSCMQTFVSSPRRPIVEAEKITEAIADMVVLDYAPLSIVEGDGFRQLMEIVAPDYTVPCRKTIRSRIIRRYNAAKEELTSQLSHVESAAITTDTWTSNTTESYMTVTEHHVTEDWSLDANVLMTRPMPERHTGENLASRLKDVVSEFGLDDKVETCVHDNARNMESAGRMCEDWSDHDCFGHTLQLCLKPAMELASVTKVVSRCRKLVGHFKHSTTLTAEMAVRQRGLGVKEHSLIQDVTTRWNSTYHMMSRLLEQRRVLTDILLDPKFTKKGDATLNLKDHEWETVSDLCDVLAAFDRTTSYMSTESHVSISEVLPIVCGLITNRLNVSEEDTGVTMRVKQAIHEELDRRYQPSSSDTAESTTALASLLDPRYKKLQFFSSHQRRMTEMKLESRLDDLPLKRNSGSDEEVPSKRRKLDFLVSGRAEQLADDELRSYLAEKVDPDADPLQWWKDNERRFPAVATVAKKVLAVPATSVPSERIFSMAGLIKNKLRNRLAGDLVDSIIFLSKNDVKVNIDED